MQSGAKGTLLFLEEDMELLHKIIHDDLLRVDMPLLINVEKLQMLDFYIEEHINQILS